MAHLEGAADWSESALESAVRQFSEEHNLKLGLVAQGLRAALTGSHISPSVFDVMHVLGKDEAMKRLKAQL